MAYANKINGTITKFNTLPFGWKGVENVDCYYETRTDLHKKDGFYPLIYPTITEYQKYDSVTNATFNGSEYTMIVLDKSDEEIEKEVLDSNTIKQDELIQQDLKLKTLITAQTYTDDEALNSQVLYPQWEYPVNYPVDFKAQDFVDATLKLFKVIQAHTSQSDWRPNDTPSLWLEIAPSGVIPVWKQPTGAHDAYNAGTQVYYPTENDTIYTSTVDANVYAPNVVLGQWEAEEVEVDPISTISEWVQPDSTNPYMSGDKVTYHGLTYESTIDNNVWSPDVYGWIEI